ncbi:hypothetical protein ACOJBO_02480 [Rhizobium beringeri]
MRKVGGLLPPVVWREVTDDGDGTVRMIFNGGFCSDAFPANPEPSDYHCDEGKAWCRELPGNQKERRSRQWPASPKASGRADFLDGVGNAVDLGDLGRDLQALSRCFVLSGLEARDSGVDASTQSGAAAGSGSSHCWSPLRLSEVQNCRK